MPVVQDIVTSLTGAPLGGVQVTIQLVTATPPGFISSGHQTILSTSKLYTAADGSWSATLIGNSGISPVGTVYRITYRNNGRVIKKFLVTVNISGGPYWVGNMATSIGISVPGPPQSLQAATGTVNGYVNLTWLAPSYAGTAAITAYKVQRDTGSGYSTVATLGSVLSYQDSIGASVTGAYRVIATLSPTLLVAITL